MPTNISKKTTIPESVSVANAIRNESSAAFRAAVPIATASNSREFGAAIIGNENFVNEYISSLLNRIALTIITSRSKWMNPWGFMNKGVLEFGETVEEIYTNLINGFAYNYEAAEKLVFKRRNPDVRTSFHAQNVAAYYPITIEISRLKKAFLSWASMNELIADIVDRMYTSWRYDEFNMMKYVLGKAIVNNKIATVSGINVSTDPDKAVVAIKAVSNAMEIMSGSYTEAGVPNYTPKERQYIILSTTSDAEIGVDVLAAAFNLDYVTFAGRKTLVDEFWKVDNARLSLLFSSEENQNVSEFKPFTSDEIEKLKTVQAVLMDENFMQIYYNLYKFTENYNGNGIWWNYFLHVWATFSHSPFSNACVFASGSGTLTALSVEIVSKTSTAKDTIFAAKIKMTTSGISGLTSEFVESTSPILVSKDGSITIQNSDTTQYPISVNIAGKEYTSTNTLDVTSGVDTILTFTV